MAGIIGPSILLFAAAFTAAGQTASSPPAGGPPATRLKAVVRDAKGRIVRNLEAPDFSVAEDGTAAILLSAKFIDAKNGGPVRLTLIFDRMRGEPARLSREAAAALLSLAGPDVRFSVWAIDRKLMLLRSWTADRKAVRAAVEAATGKVAPSGVEPAAGESAQLERAIMRTAARLARDDRVLPSVAALIAAIREQAAPDQRKAIVYFSEGLPIAEADDSLLAIASAASQADVAVYTVDASGMAITNEEEAARVAAYSTRGIGHRQVMSSPDQPTPGSEGESDLAGAAHDSPVSLLAPRSPAGQRTSPLELLAAKTGGFTIAKNNDVRGPMRRLLEDLDAFYQISYLRPNDVLDGRYHKLRLSLGRVKGSVRGPDGFYASPGLPGEFLAYELPLFDIMRRAPILDIPAYVEVMQFRASTPDMGLVSFGVEIPGRGLQFDEDQAAGLFHAHISALAVIRDRDGAIVESFGRDMPFQTASSLLEDTRHRRFLFQERVELPPGHYTLETAVQDRLADHYNATTKAFTVAPPEDGMGISSLALVSGVNPAGEDAPPDGAFQLAGKSVIPALDGVVPGGPGAVARLFFRLYSGSAGGTPEVAFEIFQNGRQIVRKPLKLGDASDGAGQVISLDVATLPAGAYDLAVIAAQGTRQVSSHTIIVIQGGPAEHGAEPEVAMRPAAELPSAPPNAEQRQLIERARSTAIEYVQHLPNFLCTQVTRRLVDDAGRDQWRSLDESTQLVTFYDGQEHYDRLTVRSSAADSGSFPPLMTSSGEFGSLLKSIFEPDSTAVFRWIRADSIRGHPVQVFSYAVDAEHSKYLVSHRVQGQPTSVISAFRGTVFLNRETGLVLRITQETSALPDAFPIRQMSLSLEYGDVPVGGQVYTLPLSFTMDVRMGRRTLVRNEVSFRSYQRFTADSHFLPARQ